MMNFVTSRDEARKESKHIIIKYKNCKMIFGQIQSKDKIIKIIRIWKIMCGWNGVEWIIGKMDSFHTYHKTSHHRNSDNYFILDTKLKCWWFHSEFKTFKHKLNHHLHFDHNHSNVINKTWTRQRKGDFILSNSL